ncbi:MAG: hypothetical protein AMXMBFR7_20930 [Planctomycetota bacterium]
MKRGERSNAGWLLLLAGLLLGLGANDVWGASGGKSSGGGSGGGGGSSSTSTGGGSSGGGGGGGGGGGSGSTGPQTQDTFDPATNGIELQINGSPNTIDGDDHAIDGTEKPSDAQTNKAPNAVGVADVDGSWVNGSGSGQTGITISGQHNDANIQGRVGNDLPKKYQDLEAFVQSVKNLAQYNIDLGTSTSDAVSTTDGTVISLTGSGNHIGTPDDFKIVYAKGSTQNGAFTENTLHLSGNGTSYGILVVEIDNPDQAQFIMSGGYKWVGLVMVVYNKRPTGSDALVDIRGGGNSNHVTGGLMLYLRNHANSSSNPGAIYGKEFYRTRGTSDIKYSFDALNKTNVTVESKSSVQVRSWRVVQPYQ